MERAAKLELDVTNSEVIDSIGSMQSGKAPGPDSFPEFFKKFPEQLAPILLSVFRESLSSQSLPPTMREATISLILKKILSLRLEVCLPSIISTDQTGFMKNRYSFFNIRRHLNILYSPSPPDIPEVLLSVDAEKAFDRVEWDYLLTNSALVPNLYPVLRHYTFPPQLL